MIMVDCSRSWCDVMSCSCMFITLDNFITNNIDLVILLNVIYRVEFNSFLVSHIINEDGMCWYSDKSCTKYYNKMAGKKSQTFCPMSLLMYVFMPSF